MALYRSVANGTNVSHLTLDGKEDDADASRSYAKPFTKINSGRFRSLQSSLASGLNWRPLSRKLLICGWHEFNDLD